MQRDQQKAATRAIVVRTASDLFAYGGYREITIRDIAYQANLSTGSIFSTFKGKDDLWIEATGAPTPDKVLLQLAVYDPTVSEGPTLMQLQAWARTCVGAKQFEADD